ncbi:IclR family transcriptional regulator [Oceanobacillus sp. J11TS1]|uniref:IclR family transcriptional regulator n=1 Tax=Oceanobacillus sp. J11TS1 TaxID=2807191 RepID=UPI001B029361|nr:IclR family transcriptional regulator [Oceanobacillus sp. J11TS1]GIO24874.1 IclR family transcriptional regulator [Oceanobacillus sp. J11TS1]
MSVKSAERVLRIFELLSANMNGMTIKEISETLQLPQSSTSGLVKTLLHENYLSINQQKRFILGPKLIPVGNAAMESLDISSLGHPSLKKLTEAVEETVFMAVLVEKELVYVAKIDSNRSIRTSAYLGGQKPLYCTGLGKAFLAFMNENDRINYLNTVQLKAITEQTITSKEELKKRLQEYRQQGYSIDDEENEDGLYCLAAPVFDIMGSIQAAISVAGPKERMLRQQESILKHLKQTAAVISAKLGYVSEEGV